MDILINLSKSGQLMSKFARLLSIFGQFNPNIYSKNIIRGRKVEKIAKFCLLFLLISKNLEKSSRISKNLEKLITKNLESLRNIFEIFDGIL